MSLNVPYKSFHYAETLWRHLHRMGLHEADESHPVLGNVKQALETLVQQRLQFSLGCILCSVLGVVNINCFVQNFFYCLSLKLFIYRYLQKGKLSGPEGNTSVYELAERALDGTVSERIKEYISKVCVFVCFYGNIFS